MSFGADGDLVFRSLEEKTNGLVRIKKDGRVRNRITTVPILEKLTVSPDGNWALILSPLVGDDDASAVLAVPTRGGATRKICSGDCVSGWSSNGTSFFVSAVGGTTVIIPVPAGDALPDFSAKGITLDPSWSKQSQANVVDRNAISPGPDPSQYVFVKTELQRNLFRVPLH